MTFKVNNLNEMVCFNLNKQISINIGDFELCTQVTVTIIEQYSRVL